MQGLLETSVKVIDRQARVQRAIDNKVDRSFRYLAGAIRRKTKSSIKKGSKNRPHSKPGSPVHSRGARIFRNTIERNYDKRTQTLVVGPKKTGFRPRVNLGGRTIPQILEYGGKFTATKPTYVPAAKADSRARKIAFLKEKQRRRQEGDTRKFTMKDLKYVVIEPGVRVIDARPTQRLAFNKTTKAQNLQATFDRIGISDPSSLQRDI